MIETDILKCGCKDVLYPRFTSSKAAPARWLRRSCTTIQRSRWQKICGDGKRESKRAFDELCSHYLFRDRLARSAKGGVCQEVSGGAQRRWKAGGGHDKFKVEELVRFSRANFIVPVMQVASFEELNARL